MKRQILCCSCTSAFADIVSSLNGNLEARVIGEKTKFLVGNLKGVANCDHCRGRILPGGACCAVSTFTDENPYFGWEDRYINPI
jgi:hypothetical protein